MKISKRQLKQIIKEEKAKLLNEQVADVQEVISQGQAFFDRVIQLSQDSEDDPAAQAALEQVVAALSADVEQRSYGYVKFKVTI